MSTLFPIRDHEHRYGYINGAGETVIPPRFEFGGIVGEFSDERAIVYDNRAYGFIDPTGEIVIPAKYRAVRPFSSRVAWVQANSGWQLIDQNHHVLTDPIYSATQSIGLLPAHANLDAVENLRDQRWGFVNAEGKVAIDFIYDYATQFSEGIAFVRQGQYVMIDTDGERRTETRYAEIARFSEGLANVTLSDSAVRCVVDKQGNEVFRHRYKDVGRFFHGLAYVAQGKKFGFVDPLGELVIPAVFDEVSNFLSEGVACVRTGPTWQLLKRDGTFVPDSRFDNGSRRDFEEGLLAVEVDGLWGAITASGKTIVSPQFSDAFWFRDGLAQVTQELPSVLRLGYINRASRFVWHMDQT